MNGHVMNEARLDTIDLTETIATEIKASKEDLLISQTNVAQQETVLKNALSRNGVASASLDEVHIVTLDQIVVPNQEELKPQAQLIQEALDRRPEHPPATRVYKQICCLQSVPRRPSWQEPAVTRWEARPR